MKMVNRPLGIPPSDKNISAPSEAAILNSTSYALNLESNPPQSSNVWSELYPHPLVSGKLSPFKSSGILPFSLGWRVGSTYVQECKIHAQYL